MIPFRFLAIFLAVIPWASYSLECHTALLIRGGDWESILKATEGGSRYTVRKGEKSIELVVFPNEKSHAFFMDNVRGGSIEHRILEHPPTESNIRFGARALTCFSGTIAIMAGGASAFLGLIVDLASPFVPIQPAALHLGAPLGLITGLGGWWVYDQARKGFTASPARKLAQQIDHIMNFSPHLEGAKLAFFPVAKHLFHRDDITKYNFESLLKAELHRRGCVLEHSGP